MKVKEENVKAGLKLNIQKTKIMAFGPITSWQIDGETMWVRSLDQEDPLEKEMATHSRILAWRIPRMVGPGGLPSLRLHRVGHD